MSDDAKKLDGAALHGGEPETVLKNYARTINVAAETATASCADEVERREQAPAKRRGITLEELRPLIDELANRESALLPAGVGRPTIVLDDGVTVGTGYDNRSITINLICRGKSTTQYLTAEQARHIAALLLAAAGREG